jgi:prophage antirepressor-like protein
MSSKLRIWTLLDDVARVLDYLNKEELVGANAILGILSHYLTTTHFEEQKDIDIRALVKTIEELDEISIELLYNKHKAYEMFVKTEKET